MTEKTKKISLFIVSFICCFCVVAGILVGYNAKAQNESQNVKKDYAIVLNDYIIPKIEGITKVLDPNGYKVSYDGGKFMPLCVGEYKIFYGDVYEIVHVLRNNPEATFVYSEEILSGYSTGDAIMLPTANIESVIGKYENYDVTISFNGQEIEKVHSSNVKEGYSFVFERGGKYAITYSSIDSTSLKYTVKDVHNITVLNNATIIMNEIPEELFFGSSINIGAVYGLYDGDTYPAQLKVELPSGDVENVTDIVYVPKHQGTYKFVATSIIEGQEVSISKTVNIIISSGNLFSNAYSISKIEAGVDLPSYSLEKGKSVYIQAQTSASSIYYSKIIDLKEFDKDDSLINFIPYSDSESNTQDEIRVTLIDAHNINNQLTLKWWYKRSISTETYMSVYLNGKEYGAINNEKIEYGEDGDVRTYHGSVSWGCYFDAYNQGVKARMFNLHFDYEENAIYSVLRNYYSASDKLFKIIDMDDPLKIGYTNVWEGFETGEVYLKIEFVSTQPTSGIFVESVAGQKLNQEELPDISNDTCFIISSEYDQMPNGAVNYFYPFPKYIKNMLVDSEVTITLTKGGQVVDATEQGFKPTEAGEYTLTFSAIDNYGKKNEKSFTFTVNQTPNTINVETPSNINVELFTDYVIPEIEVTGGSGNLVIEKRLLLDGEPLESFAGAYFIDTTGSYVIEIKVTDFLGYSVTELVELDVDNDFVSLSLESDILAVRAGQTAELPKFSTYDFINETVPEKTLEIVANGNIIKTFSGDVAYSFNVPEGYANLTLKYYSGKGTEREKVLEKNVKVLPKNIDKISDFIITEGNVEPLSLLDGVVYIVSDNAKIKFPNPVPVGGLSLAYGIDAETMANFENFIVRLKDAYNPELMVEFKFYDFSTNGTAKVEVNDDGKIYIANYSSDSYDNDRGYDSERKAYVGKGYYSYESYFDATLNKLNYASGTEMAAVSSLKDGRVFEGFSSGLVFVEFEVNSVADNTSKLIIKTVSNQNMDYFIESQAEYTDNDTIGPNLLFNKKMVDSRMTINSEFTVSYATAWDFVQSGSSYARVTVKDPKGNQIINKQLTENEKIILNQYGAYTIQYRATDSLGKSTVTSFNVVVYDNEVPTIIVNGTIKSEYAVGTTLTLPNATVSDNCSQNLVVDVYIKTPSANYLLLGCGQTYKFEEKGAYLLVYSAQDDFGNLRRITYDITVK